MTTITVPLVPLLAEVDRALETATTGPRLRPAQLYATLPLLTPRNIRVLDISPTKNRAEPLSGTLRVVDLANSPRFTALSYVWGDGAPSPTSSAIAPTSSMYTLFCNEGLQTLLTRNCWEALVSLRHISGKKRGLTVWVDAICINQQDDMEKMMQLPLMEEIYTFAETTWIWLGSGSDDTSCILSCFRRFNLASGLPSVPGYPWLRGAKRLPVWNEVRRFLRDNILWTYFWQFKVDSWAKSYLSTPGFKTQLAERVDILASLLGGSWMERAWTFQEILLASNPVIVCGQDAVDWVTWQRGVHLSLLIGQNPTDLLWFDLRSALHNWVGRNNGLPYCTFHSIPPGSERIGTRAVPWLRLFKLYDTTLRPIRWNDRELRNSPSSRDDGMWTAQTYMRKGCFHARAITFSLVIIEVAFIMFQAWLMFWVRVWSDIRGSIWGLFFLLWGTLVSAPLGVIWWRRWGRHISGKPHKKLFSGKVKEEETFGIPELGSIELTPAEIYEQWRAARQTGISLSPKLGHTAPLGSIYQAGVLEALRERRATVAHDKVFSLYGVMKRMGIQPPTPDYSESVGDVYHRVLLTLIQWNPSLSVLLLDTGLGTQLAGVPSWVPDWTTAAERSWIPRTYIYGSITDNRPFGRTLIPTPTPMAVLSPCKRRLTLRGAVVGKVTEVFGAFEKINIGDSDLQNFGVDNTPLWHAMYVISQWLMWVRVAAPLLETYETMPAAVAAVLSGGTELLHLKDGAGNGAYRDAFNLWYQAMLKSQKLAYLQTQEEGGGLASNSLSYSALDVLYTLDTFTKFLRRELLSQQKALRFAFDCVNQLAGKRGLFYSVQGHIGTGPVNAVKGDNIVVLHGPTMAMITRTEAEGRHVVVGPAYVPGLTFMNEHRDKSRRYTWEDITLV